MTSASFPMRRDDGAPATGPQPGAGAPRLRDALPPGTLVGGGYRIERTLGQGGFGIVYLAVDLALQRPVAIKEFLPVHLVLRGEGLQIALREAMHRDAFGRGLTSFLREARLLAQFDHPSLVRVYRFWEENQTAYMAMPYYEGPTLTAARQAMLRPPEEGWLRDQLLLPLIGALETLHEGHCLHRDVSPSNILLLPDGRPLLLDFGSARRVVGDMTQPLTAIVNPAYAAIEQYAESPNLPQGPWTDVYGLACVAYYVLSGRAPAPATVRAVNDAALMPMAEVGQLISKSFPNLHYSPAFLAALDRALALRPNERPQSAAALREALISPHVQPDLAIGETRRAPVPPPVDEIRRAPDTPMPDAAAATPDAEGGDADEQAIRATIQAALGEIADWPTIAPVRRGQSLRIEPVLDGAGGGADGSTAATAAAEARRAAPAAKPVHLTVVAGSDAAAAPIASPGLSAREATAAPVTGAAAGSEPVMPLAAAADPSSSAAMRAAQSPIDPALAAVPGDDAGPRRPTGGRTRSGDQSTPRQEPRLAPQEPPAAPLAAGAREAYPQTRPEARIARPARPPAPPPPVPFESVVAPRPSDDATPPQADADSGRERVPADGRVGALPLDPIDAPAAPQPDAVPPMAEVLPLERFSATDDDAATQQQADDEWPPRRRRGGLWAAAAVVAAAVIGGGLWYAPDLGHSALAWLGLPGAAPVVATRDRAPATTDATAPAEATADDRSGVAAKATQLAQQTAEGAAVVPPAPRVDATNGSGTGANADAATAATSDSAETHAPATSTAPGTATAANTSAAAIDSTPAAAQVPASPAAGDDNTSPPAAGANADADAGTAPSSRSATRAAPARVAVAPRSRPRKPAAPTPAHVAQAKPSYPPTARAACGDRHNFSLYYCMKAQCRLARYSGSTECIRLREDDDVE